MSLAPGSSIGPYVIVALEGSGGMGHVYRALDTRLKRDVAIKILPGDVSTDPDRLARFQREAEVLAALHHSNIASVYGIEEFEGARAIVMEFVDGETLAERVSAGPLPTADVEDIARQLADALDAAHERGIVHRDLKPANIKVAEDGTLKVLDFGLAKAIERSGEVGGSLRHGGAAGAHRPDEPDLSASPTLTSPAQMTGVGVILGTAAYMAPEQARGRPVDKRADIWAYGCVLFELLSGRRAFDGETVTDVLAAVVAKEPEWSDLPPSTSAVLRRIIGRCLQKDPRSRLRDIGDVRNLLEASTGGAPSTATPERDSQGQHSQFSWKLVTGAALGLVIGGLAVGLSMRSRSSSEPTQSTRFVVLPPEGGAFNSTYIHQAIAPDGSRLAFLAYAANGPSMVWVRALDDLTPRSLPGTEGAQALFWSPDSTQIGFLADDTLKRVGVDGGAVQKIIDAPRSRLQLITASGPNGSWSPNGTIVFGPSLDGRLSRVDANGGTPTPTTTIDQSSNQSLHLLPEFLPDGQHFLFFSRPEGEVWAGSIDGRPQRRLLNADCKAVYASGYLLFVRGNTLYRQPFNPDSLEVGPEPTVMAEGVRCNPSNGGGGYSVSANGALTYRAGEVGTPEQLTWYGRSGQVQATVDGTSPARDVRLSPADGRVIAVDEARVSGSARNSDIWSIDVLRGSRQRLTSDGSRNQMPVWAPDGSELVFSQQSGEQTRLVRFSAKGVSREEVLLEANCVQRPTDWSSDRRFIVYDRSCVGESVDVWAFAPDKGGKPFTVVASKFNERQASISPDVKWVAFTSDESGKSQVFVQSFPNPGIRVPVSIDGGAHPRWRKDGKELVFMDLQRRLVVVDVDLQVSPPNFGTPRVLFQTNAPRDLAPNASFYDMTGDAQRFLVANVVEGLQSPPIVVVLNWLSSLPAHR